MAIRSFISFETPDEIRDRMFEFQSNLRESGADGRWEPKEKFHATIKFLGNVDENQLPTIISTIEQTVKQFNSFEITYLQLGCFPNLNRPRVIWIGCENRDGTLAILKNSLDDMLLQYGFEREEREFHPHVTLGRVKSGKGLNNLTPLLQSLTFEPSRFQCREILLMKSVLKPQGSVYSVLHKFLLH